MRIDQEPERPGKGDSKRVMERKGPVERKHKRIHAQTNIVKELQSRTHRPRDRAAVKRLRTISSLISPK